MRLPVPRLLPLQLADVYHRTHIHLFGWNTHTHACAHKLAAISSLRGSRARQPLAVTVTFAKLEFTPSHPPSCSSSFNPISFQLAELPQDLFLGLSYPESIRPQLLCIHDILAQLSHGPLKTISLCSPGKKERHCVTFIPLTSAWAVLCALIFGTWEYTLIQPQNKWLSSGRFSHQLHTFS